MSAGITDIFLKEYIPENNESEKLLAKAKGVGPHQMNIEVCCYVLIFRESFCVL